MRRAVVRMVSMVALVSVGCAELGEDDIAGADEELGAGVAPSWACLAEAPDQTFDVGGGAESVSHYVTGNSVAGESCDFHVTQYTNTLGTPWWGVGANGVHSFVPASAEACTSSTIEVRVHGYVPASYVRGFFIPGRWVHVDTGTVHGVLGANGSCYVSTDSIHYVTSGHDNPYSRLRVSTRFVAGTASGTERRAVQHFAWFLPE